MFLQIWFLPTLLLATAAVTAFPLSRYLAWVMDGRYRPVPGLAWIERRLDSGPQDWKQYAASLLVFNTVLFVFGFLVLALQPWMPFNPDGKTLLAPSTIFHSVVSFMTNTDLQHYTGEQHLSNFSQVFFGITNLFLSAAIGLAALTAIIRSLRGQARVGNFYLDIWRILVYLFLPFAFALGALFISQGCPMTFDTFRKLTTLEGAPQTLVLGPVAAFESIKMLGTNGGGFYGMNSAHPFENPTGLSNFFNTLGMMIFPFALVLMYGRMLGRFSHGLVIFIVMLVMMGLTVAWSVRFDTLAPNPAFTARPAGPVYALGPRALKIPPVAGLPVNQRAGNLEGKELRFGAPAGAAFAAITTDVTCGAVNAEADSLNPLAALAPMVGMWLNCIFGGKGVGMINMLFYIVIAIFVAGMMVGRTPEYLGRKIEAREMKLATIALLIHPLLILLPTGLFAVTQMGLGATSNPGAHGLSQMLYQFSSSSANNGSAFDGLAVTYGFYNNPNPAPHAVAWDIASGIVIVIGRFFPIVAPIAMAGFLGAKKPSPAGLGTLRVDGPTFGVLLFGTIMVIGALLFFPVAALGPIAEHLGPIPFGG